MGAESAGNQYRYWAFISYSNKDRSWAKWLHKSIETYGIPAQLISHSTPVGDPAPKRFHPLFRDRDELPASSDLGAQIEEALKASRYLIIVCSPHAAGSKWVNKEVETFQRLGRGDRILAMIVGGKPHSGDWHECFPPALRRHEPIAADARAEGDGRNGAKVKLLAGMLGVSFDVLHQRDMQRRVRRLEVVTVALAAIAIFIISLAWNAHRQRMRAIESRHDAEQVLQFLVYEMRDELVSIGRLDISEKVGRSVDEYYSQIGVEPSQPVTLYNRAAALENEGDLLKTKGDLKGAAKAYVEGLTIRQELVRGEPSNMQWQRALSLSYAHIGDLLLAAGGYARALEYYREGVATSQRLLEIYPFNVVWLQDLAVGYGNIGDVLNRQGNYADAMKAYSDSLEIRRRLAQENPSDNDRQRGLAISHDRMSDALNMQGDLAGARNACWESLVIRQRLVDMDPSNAQWQWDLSVSRSRMGGILKKQGDLEAALRCHRQSLVILNRLTYRDPSNITWQENFAVCYEQIADILRAQKDLAGAIGTYVNCSAILQRLTQSEPSRTGWSHRLSIVYRKLGDLSMEDNAPMQAEYDYKEEVLIRRRLAQSDPCNTAWRHNLAASLDRLGDALKGQEDQEGALKAYRESLMIREQLASSEASNAKWQRSLWVSYVKIARAYDMAKDSEAERWWSRAYEQLSGMKKAGLSISAADEKTLEQLRAKVGQ